MFDVVDVVGGVVVLGGVIEYGEVVGFGWVEFDLIVEEGVVFVVIGGEVCGVLLEYF